MKKSFVILFSLFALFFNINNSVSAQAGKDEALKTIGSLSGLLMYNTYTTIGSIGDGFEEGVYDLTYLTDVMNEQIGGVASIIEQMNALNSSRFIDKPADKTYLKKCIETFELLKIQATALINYAKSKSEADGEKFQNARKSAWVNISDLLGLEEE